MGNKCFILFHSRKLTVYVLQSLSLHTSITAYVHALYQYAVSEHLTILTFMFILFLVHKRNQGQYSFQPILSLFLPPYLRFV